MAGIAQTVLINAEPIVGFRGKLANSNSLLFGKDAGTTLNPGDTALMSSQNIASLPALGGSPWTIEYWVRHQNVQFDEGIVHINGQAILGSANFVGGMAIFHTANTIQINNYLINNASFTIPSSAIPSQQWQLSDWYHVALVKNTSSNITAFINGVRSPTGILANPNNYTLPFTILGSWRNNNGLGTTNNLIGNLYNLKVTPNLALYDVNTSTISVPTLKSTLSTGTTLLLLAEQSKTLVNSAGGASLSTRAGVTVASTYTPFDDPISRSSIKPSISSPFTSNGSGSYYFYGRTNSFGTFPGSSRFAMGTGDFTIEWFSYAQNNSRTATAPLWYETGGNVDIGISFDDLSGVVGVNIHHGATTINVGSIAGNSYYKQWLHWAIIGTGGLIYCYCNGVALNPLGDSLAYDITSLSGTLYIGKKGTAATQNESFYGYITNVRVVKGQIVYTGNFTTPTGNLQRFQFANPYGGSNTQAVRTDQTAFLMAP